MLGWVQDYLLDPSRTECVGDQRFRRIIPQEQVHSLPFELVNDPADSTTALANTGPDGVKTGDTALQGKLDVSPALASDRFDLDQASSDFGHLLCKEAHNVLGPISGHRVPPPEA
jgi:hypothetical protein